MGIVLATVALVVVSLFAAQISFFMMRKTYDPHVIVYAASDPDRPSIITLVVENVGEGVAYDVRFSLSRDLPARAFGLAPETAKPAKRMTEGH